MTTIFETIMLICFGASWPISLMKNIKAGTAKNMSLQFNLLITFGYIAGITAKIISGHTGFVLVVYFINLIFVTANIVVYFINKHADSLSEKPVRNHN